jgi:predicted RNA-binding Zn-ribbon protein involved in translation (DUF1610 family)
VDVTLLSGKVVRNVEADVCPQCGERYYDLDAVRLIEKAWTKRSSRWSADRPTISMCPTCGSKRIRRRPVRVAISNGKKVRVEFAVCPDCGEQLFDMEAMRRLEAADRRRGKRKMRHARTASLT